VAEVRARLIEAKLDGANKRDLQNALVTVTRGDLDPMTMEYVQIKFTDDKVTLVKLEPRGDVLHGKYPRIRMQALQKIDGQWKPVEDWSTSTRSNTAATRKLNASRSWC
jgi:hypothetical protein